MKKGHKLWTWEVDFSWLSVGLAVVSGSARCGEAAVSGLSCDLIGSLARKHSSHCAGTEAA